MPTLSTSALPESSYQGSSGKPLPFTSCDTITMPGSLLSLKALPLM
ncbi:Uncharacterised protein [Segatella copri]|nr:Uncharacterised protein [Segatella copri]